MGTDVFAGAEYNRSLSDNGRYVAFVEQAVKDYETFRTFKTNPDYRAILEHVSPELGLMYLNVVAGQTPYFFEILDRFKINDLVGSPQKIQYGPVEISPSTLRYVKVASDIVTMFGADIGDVVEIGVGYGGQMLILDQVCAISHYTLFDLKPVLDLASKYLECHILNSSYNTSTINQFDGSACYDLVISNYAFSELPSRLQRVYIEKIMQKAKRGYLTMNSGLSNSVFKNDKLSLDELRDLLPEFNVLDDNPLNYPGTYIIVWGL